MKNFSNRAAESTTVSGHVGGSDAQKDAMVCTVPRAKRPDVTLLPDVILIIGQLDS